MHTDDKPRRNEHAGNGAVRRQRALYDRDNGVVIHGRRQRFGVRCAKCGTEKTIEQRMIGDERRLFGVVRS